jgi:hypothetical protein
MMWDIANFLVVWSIEKNLSANYSLSVIHSQHSGSIFSARAKISRGSIG